MSNFRLGKKRGVVEDPRTLKLAKYVDLKTLPVPPSTSSHTIGVEYDVYGNDQYGDCTCAGIGNFLRSVSHGQVKVTVDDVLKAYSDITGFKPDDPSTDNGAYELDVLNYWRKTGVGGHKLDGFAKIEVTPDLIHAANWLFGGVYVGLALPVTAQEQTGPSEGAEGDPKLVWKQTYGGRASKPGSWGGHAVVIEDTTPAKPTGVRLATWGFRQRATWDFITEYCDEAYAPLTPEWLARHDGKSPQGFDLEQLEKDLSALQQK